MARMNTLIPLQVRQSQPLNALMQGAQTAAGINSVRRENAVNQLYQDFGPQIAAGQPEGLDQLARFDPGAAQGIRANEERLRLARAAGARAAASAARDAEERKKLEQEFQNMRQGAIAYEQAQSGDPRAFNTWSMKNGGTVTLDDFPVFLATAEGGMEMLERLGAGQGFGQPEPYKPQSAPGKVAADVAAGVLPADTPLRGGGTKVEVNTGSPYPGLSKLGEGYTYLYDGDGNLLRDDMGRPMSAPIPGSKAEREAREGVEGADANKRKLDLAVADYDRKFSIVDDKITEAIGAIEQYGRLAVGVGSLSAGLPETPARNLQATIDTVKANLGFEELQAMRDSSPTGGALGQVTEREIAFLQAIQGNLDLAQSPEQVLSVLRDIQTRRREFAAERRRIMGGEAPAATDQAFEAFAADPKVQSAAQAAGVTVQEMWDIKQGR